MNRLRVEHILDRIIAAEATGDERERLHQLELLAQQPDGAIGTLQEILSGPDKDRWPTAVQVLGAIGYPDNTAALPIIIAHAADPNSPASFDALHLLNQLPQNLLDSELIALSWPKSASQISEPDHDDAWVDHIHAACAVALTLGIHYCEVLSPMLVYLLAQPTYRQRLHPLASEEILPWSVFAVLEAVDKSLIPYGLPILLELANTEKSHGKPGRGTALLRLFDAQALEPYSHLPIFSPSFMANHKES